MLNFFASFFHFQLLFDGMRAFCCLFHAVSLITLRCCCQDNKLMMLNTTPLMPLRRFCLALRFALMSHTGITFNQEYPRLSPPAETHTECIDARRR